MCSPTQMTVCVGVSRSLGRVSAIVSQRFYVYARRTCVSSTKGASARGKYNRPSDDDGDAAQVPLGWRRHDCRDVEDANCTYAAGANACFTVQSRLVYLGLRKTAKSVVCDG